MKRISPQKLPLLLAIVAAWLPGAGAAQTGAWYQVEMIVFEHLYPRYDGEYWFKDPGLAPLARSVVLRERTPAPEAPGPGPASEAVDAPAPGPVLPAQASGAGGEKAPPPLQPYTFLPEQDNRLGNIYRMMRQSRDYRPHYHVSWLQPAVDGAAARSVHVQSRKQGNLFELTMPPLLVTDPMPADFYEPVELIFDGTVRIRSSLYLHVDLDLVLFQQPPFLALPDPAPKDSDVLPVDDQTGASPGGIPAPGKPLPEAGGSATKKEKNPVDYIRLTETRRIRLNELHYFDHPMFGVILQVSRYERENGGE